MATPIGDLVVRFGANTAGYERGVGRVQTVTQKWTSRLRGVNRNLQSYNQAVAKAGQGTNRLGGFMGSLKSQFVGFAAAAVGVYTVLNKIRQAITGVEKVNQELASSFAIMGNISDEMKEKLKNQAFDAAYATKFGADEAGKAYFYLTSAGLDAQSSLMSLSTVAKSSSRSTIAAILLGDASGPSRAKCAQ